MMRVVMFVIGVIGMLVVDIHVEINSMSELLEMFVPLLSYSPFIFCMSFPIYLEYKENKNESY